MTYQYSDDLTGPEIETSNGNAHAEDDSGGS